MKEYKIIKFRKEHLDKILELYKFVYNKTTKGTNKTIPEAK